MSRSKKNYNKKVKLTAQEKVLVKLHKAVTSKKLVGQDRATALSLISWNTKNHYLTPKQQRLAESLSGKKPVAINNLDMSLEIQVKNLKVEVQSLSKDLESLRRYIYDSVS